jgi:hypothetical protein
MHVELKANACSSENLLPRPMHLDIHATGSSQAMVHSTAEAIHGVR